MPPTCFHTRADGRAVQALFGLRGRACSHDCGCFLNLGTWFSIRSLWPKNGSRAALPPSLFSPHEEKKEKENSRIILVTYICVDLQKASSNYTQHFCTFLNKATENDPRSAQVAGGAGRANSRGPKPERWIWKVDKRKMRLLTFFF